MGLLLGNLSNDSGAGAGDAFLAECRIGRPRDQVPRDEPPYYEWHLPDGRLWGRFYRVGNGYLVRFPGVADFEISPDARRATCWPVSEADEWKWHHLYLNQVRPLMRSRRGAMIFHASSVEIDGSAVAFAAESRGGKSTLAAAFATSGAPFLTDDGLNVEPREGGFAVGPDHPSIRLRDDTLKELMPEGAKIAARDHGVRKSRVPVQPGLAFCAEPRRLVAAYFLQNRGVADVTIERLAPRDALFRWLSHAFVLDAEDKALIGVQFTNTAALADTVPSFELDYPRRYDQLARVRQRITAHAKELAS